MASLLKVNRTICETTNRDGSQIIIGKNEKKVFNVHGSDLQLIASLMPSGTIQWEAGIDENINTRYAELMASR